MKEFFSDGIWQSIGVFVTISIAVIVYIIQRKKKELSYNIVSNELIGTKSELTGKIDIVWNGSSVDNVHLVKIFFRNTGNIPIKREDFDKDIMIILNKNAMIMERELLKSSPTNLEPEFKTISKNGFSINPLLLNKKDSFIVKLLVCDYTGIVIDTRIVGINHLKNMVDYNESLKIPVYTNKIIYYFFMTIILIFSIWMSLIFIVGK